MVHVWFDVGFIVVCVIRKGMELTRCCKKDMFCMSICDKECIPIFSIYKRDYTLETYVMVAFLVCMYVCMSFVNTQLLIMLSI